MPHRTELWIDAEPPVDLVGIPLDDLSPTAPLPDADVALTAASRDADPNTTPKALHRHLRTRGRSLNNVVVGERTMDLTDGLPVEHGTLAHYRAGWIEVAERCVGPASALAQRLNPTLSSWTPTDRGDWDVHTNDRIAAWVQALSGRRTHATTHVVRTRWGLAAERLRAWWMHPPPGVDRAVGFVWTPDHPEVVARIQWAGGYPHINAHATWWVGTPSRHWPRDVEGIRRIREVWHPDVGDRESRIAFVGADLPIDELDQSFDACIMSEDERSSWHRSAMTPDPFRGQQ